MTYCSITFNGRPFDLDLEGYTTANVEGRGILDQVLSTINIPGRDGTFIFDQKLPERILTVHYRLQGNNAAEYLQRLYALHDALKSDGDVVIQFGDEAYYRFGRLYKANDPPYDAYRGFGSFTLICQDPYRYKDIAALTGTSIVIPQGSAHPLRIRSITATFSASSTGFTITNVSTGRKIILTGTFTEGQVLTIDPEGGRVLLNGQNIMNRIDFIASDWHGFKIFAGNNITASQAITLNLSGRAL